MTPMTSTPAQPLLPANNVAITVGSNPSAVVNNPRADGDFKEVTVPAHRVCVGGTRAIKTAGICALNIFLGSWCIKSAVKEDPIMNSVGIACLNSLITVAFSLQRLDLEENPCKILRSTAGALALGGLLGLTTGLGLGSVLVGSTVGLVGMALAQVAAAEVVATQPYYNGRRLRLRPS